MKRRKLLKSIVAMVALVAMLAENTFSVMGAVTTDAVDGSYETVLTEDTGSEDNTVPEAEETDALSVTDEAGDEEESSVSTDREVNINIEDVTEVNDEPVYDASVEAYEDKIQVKGQDEVTLYLNTDQMLASDSYELKISGSADAVYSGSLKGELSKDSSGIYNIEGLDKKTVSLEAVSLSKGMTAEYSIRSDGNPQIALISADAPKAEKELRITDSGFEVKGLGYDELSLELDAASLPTSDEYGLYIKTAAAVRCNGEYVRNSVVEPLISEETSLRLSNLAYEEFTIYIKGTNTDRIYASYSIDSIENGVISATVSHSDKSVDFIHEDEENADEEDEEEVKNEKRLYEYSDADVFVTATLEDPDAIPDDADFVVTRVTSESDGYNYDAYIQALNDNSGKITGDADTEINENNVLLYDIGFFTEDEDGNRIELQPKEGAVKISIRFKKDQLDTSLEAADVTTVHLPLTDSVKEEVNSTEEATDISASDIKVEVVNNSATENSVDFTLNDFSVTAVLVDGKMAPGTHRTFRDILGRSVLYGVVADEATVFGDLESTIAVDKLHANNGGTSIQSPRNGRDSNPGSSLIGSFDGQYLLYSKNGGGGQKSDFVIYTTEEAAANMGKQNSGVIVDTSKYTPQQISSMISSMISAASSMSTTLFNEPSYAYSDVKEIRKDKGNKFELIDCRGLGEGTFYVEFAPGEFARFTNDTAELNIALDENQNLVLNIPDSEVNFPHYYGWIGTKYFETDAGEEQDFVCQHIVFNCPNATTASTVAPTDGIFLLANATDFATKAVSAGWLVTNKVTSIGGQEWHCIWHDMPPGGSTEEVIKAYKTVNGNTPKANQKFWFELYAYGNNPDGIKAGTLIEAVQNNGEEVSFSPISYSIPGIYGYKVIERNVEADGFINDSTVYIVKHNVEQNSETGEMSVKIRYIAIKDSKGDEHQLIWEPADYKKIKFCNCERITVPYSFDVTKLFDATGADWPDGAEFTFELKTFDGGQANSGANIIKYGPLPEETKIDNSRCRITLTKDNRTGSFGTVQFELIANDSKALTSHYFKGNDPYKTQGWYSPEYPVEVWCRAYMYTIKEIIPENKVNGVTYSEKTIYLKIFADTILDHITGKYRLEVKDKISLSNTVGSCYDNEGKEYEFTNKYNPGSLKVKKLVLDTDGKTLVNSDEEFDVVVYSINSLNKKVYYDLSGKQTLSRHSETVKAGGELTYYPLPVDTTYYVYEIDEKGEEVKKNGQNGIYTVTYGDNLNSNNSINITPSNKDGLATVKNTRRKGSIKLVKSDSKTGNKLAGVTFELYKDSVRYPDANTSYVTDSNGEITVENLPWGTYYFKETGVPAGYVVPGGNTKSVTIDADNVNDVITIDVDNTPIEGDFLLHKVDDSKEQNPLAGAKFMLYCTNGGNETAVRTSGRDGLYSYDENGIATELDTDAKGNLSVTGLPYGNYRIKETKAPEGYNLAASPVEFKIDKNGAVVEYYFPNTPVKANVEFIKIDDKDTPIQSVPFTLYKEAGEDDIAINTVNSDEHGHVYYAGLGTGSYYFAEGALEGYAANTNHYTFTISEEDNGKTVHLDVWDKILKISETAELEAVVNTPLKGKAELFKYVLRGNEKRPLEGAVFELYKTDGGSDTKIGDTYTTDSRGLISASELEWGSYEFREITPPTGFNPLEGPVKFVISRNTDFSKAVRVEAENTPIKGYVQLLKVDALDEDTKLNGVKFDLYEGTPSVSGNCIGHFETHNGLITKEDVGALEYGSYFFKETETNEGYKFTGDGIIEFAITENEKTIELTATNDRLPGEVIFEKWNSDYSEKLDGAVYELFSSNENGPIQKLAKIFGQKFFSKGEYTTANGGVIEIKDLPWGDYYFIERVAPKGYILDEETEYHFTIKADHLKAELTYANGAKDDEEKGAIKLIKDDGEGNALAGAEFRLYKDNAPYPDSEKTYITDNNGEIFVEDLPWGTYYFVEIAAPEGFVQPEEGDAWAKTESVTINSKTTISTVPFHALNQSNTPIYGSLLLKKVDENGDALEGAKFSLVSVTKVNLLGLETENNVKVTGDAGEYVYDKTAGLISTKQELDTNGALLHVTGLPYGHYRVYEEVAPPKYKKITGCVFDFWISENEDEKYIEVENTPVLANVKFIKTDLGGTMLKGAEFKLYKKTGDNEYADLGLITSDDGLMERTGLGVGRYYVQETKAPEGYELNETQYFFTVTAEDDGKYMDIENADAISEGEALIKNTPKKGSVKLLKAVAGTNDGLKGAIFDLYRKGETTPFIKGIESDESGYVTVEGLDWGTYFFKEFKAPEGYVLDDKTEYTFEINAKNVSETVTVDLKGKELRADNTPIHGSAELIKQDSVTGKPIKGAKFALYNAADDTVVDGYGEMYSDEDGVIRTQDNLKAGRYYFKEEEAPEGYTTKHEKYEFEITQENMGSPVKAGNDGIAPNPPIPGKAELLKYTKTDDDNIKALSGAKFKLYIKKEGIHPFKPYEEYREAPYETNEQGIIFVDGLKWGEYYFEEIEAPEGYKLNEKLEDRQHYFTISATQLDYTGEQKLTHENTPYKGSVKLIKEYAIGGSKQGVLEGAKFSFHKLDGTEIKNETTEDGWYVTDKNGEIQINDLDWGSYYFYEEEAPEGFAMPANRKSDPLEISAKNVEESIAHPVTAEMINDKIYGNVRLIKIDDQEPVSYLAGAHFALFKEDGNPVYVVKEGEGEYTYSDTEGDRDIITPAGGIIAVRQLPYGRYYFKETIAPGDYEISPDDYWFEIKTDQAKDDEPQVTVTCINTKIFANVEFIKADSSPEFPLAGVTFGLYKVVEDGDDIFLGEEVSDDNGYVSRLHLPVGSYYFTEVSVPDNAYVIPSDAKYTFKITEADKDQTVTLDGTEIWKDLGVVVNKRKLGKVKLYKFIDGDKSDALKGAKFDLYKEGVDEPIKKDCTTGDDGTYYTDDLEWGSYYFIETWAPDCFEYDSTVHHGFVISSADIEEIKLVYVNNTRKPGSVDIEKLDSVDGKPISGIEFNLYKNYIDENNKGTIVTTLRTGNDGKASYDGLKWGDYALIEQENENTKTYVVDKTPHRFTISATNLKESFTGPAAIYNDRIKGNVELKKEDEDTLEPLAEVQFELYKVEPDRTFKVNTYTTNAYGRLVDEKGNTIIGPLYYGEYFFKETTPAGYEEYKGDLSFEIKYDGQLVSFIDKKAVKNTPKKGSAVIHKVDENTKPLAGATFELWSDKPKKLGEQLSTLINGAYKCGTYQTNSDGEIKVTGLPWGNYYFIETVPPAGYEIIEVGKKYEFTIDEKTVSSTVDVATVKNRQLLGTLELTKEDEETREKLEGAEFKLFMIGEKEDTDVSAMYGASEGVFRTNDSGMIIVPDVKWGKYYFKETKAPEGFEEVSEADDVRSTILVVNETKINDKGTVIQPQTTTVRNKKGYGYVSLKKEFQVLEGQPDVSRLSGVRFTLFNDTTNEEVGTYETDENGEITVDKIPRLPYGKYHFEEVSVPADISYGVSKLPLSFEITKSNPETDPIVFTFTNSEVRASAEFVKVEENTGNKIAGVRFGVFNVNNPETPVTEVVSKENGLVRVEHLPMGSYYFKEYKDSAALLGYTASDDKFTFDITDQYVVKEGEEEKTVPVYLNGDKLMEVKEVANPPIMGSIKLEKYGKNAAGTRSQLSVKDAEFELYKNGKLYLSAEEVAKHVIGKEIVITGLSWGEYYFKEIKAPEGYALPADGADKTNVVRLFAGNANASVETPLVCSMTDDTIKVYISKREIGGAEELPGASMALYEKDASGKIADKPLMTWTSGKTAKLFEVGSDSAEVVQGRTYVLREELAPDNYTFAKDIEFTVNEDGSVTALARVIGSGNGMTIIMEDAPLKVTISKKELGTDKELAGAKLRIMQGETVVESWSSVGKPHTLTADLTVGKEYVLEETNAPKGYYTAPPIRFTIKDDGTLRIISDASARATVEGSVLTMYDRPINVEISKKRLSGGPKDYVAGAGLALYDINGEKPEQIYAWISPESGAVTIEHGLLEVGKRYRVVEVETPDGYIKAPDLEFVVKDYNEFGKTDATSMVTQSVEMYDDVVKTVISKKSMSGSDELAGARLQIIDAQGKIKVDFISGNKPALITSIASESALSAEEKKEYEKYNVIFDVKLKAGADYVLREVSAPAGYALAADQAFKIDEKGIQSPSPVVMRDKPLEILLSKKDIADGSYLAGASLELLSAAGNKLAEWVSSDKPVLISIREVDETETANYAKVFPIVLPEGKYVLHESKAPLGYAVAPDVEITIDGSCVRNANGTIREESMYDSKEGTTSVYGTKKWVTPKDSNGKALPDYVYPEITIELYRDSTTKGVIDTKPVDSVTLKNGATSFAFGPLDRYKTKGGENYEYTYKVVEVMSDDAKKRFVSKELPMKKTEKGTEVLYETGFENTPNQEYTDLKGEKTFILKKDKDGKIAKDQYETITIRLLQNGKRIDIDGDGKEESVIIENGAVDNNGKASYTFKNLPKYDLTTGNAYAYSVEETGAESYGTDIVYKGNEVSIFNTPKENPFYIKGVKNWIDPDGVKRPEITMQLFRDGVLYKETKLAADDTFSFGPLYEHNLGWSNDEGDNKETADGHKFKYEIKETGATGYNVTIEGSGKDMVILDGIANVTVTNRYAQEYIEISGRKFWNDSGDSSKRPKVTINLYAADSTGKKEQLVDTVVIPNTKSTYEFGTSGRKQLPKYDDNGKEISYRVEEVEIPGYISQQNGYDFTNTPSKVRISKLDATDRKELPGAVLSIAKKGSKSEVVRWTSTNTPYYIEGLELGEEYVLTEISAPKGYVVASPITFKVGVDGVEQKVEMLDDPIVGSVVLTKLDSETREKLSGAVFNLYGPDGNRIRATGSTGDYIYSEGGSGSTDLVVASSGELKVDKLPYGAYYFKEVTAPSGYELSTASVSFTIADKDAAITVSFVNTRRKGSVTLVKTNEDGSERLAGAEFELYSRTPRTAGQAAASTIFSDAYYRYGTYTTDSEGRIRVNDLPWDDYYFLETKAPEGYEINRDLTGDPLVYTFTINEESSGSALIDLGTVTNSRREGEVLGERRPPAEKAAGVLGVRSAPKGGVLGTRVTPATGDASAIALWIAVMVACIGTIVWLLADRRKKRAK